MNDSQSASLVLVADDEVQTTIMLTRIFEREGYRVHSTYDGESAYEAAITLLPDLILLDVQMPKMNGFETLQALRENPVTTNIPTIIVTAKARQPSDIAYGLNLGADDFVQKPFDPRELLARASSKIRAHKLEEALQRRSQELEILLRVGEALNQHVNVNELLNLVPYLVLDLIPGSISTIYRFNDGVNDLQFRVETKGIPPTTLSEVEHKELVERFLAGGNSVYWNRAEAGLINKFTSGIAVPLQHGGKLLGMLLLASNNINFTYDENHLRLFEGIGRQAALALRNAELHEIQIKYASQLEVMVEAKTEELKSAQEMLIRSEKLASIGELAASIAHEINNPLQPIRINLGDMLEDIQNNIPIDVRAIQITQESVERIRRIVNQLLDFAGKRSNSTAEMELLDIGKIIETVVSLNRKFFEKEDMQIRLDIPTELRMYGNKDQLEQVFMNLVLNAQAAMERGGVLEVKGWINQNDIITQFADTGCGIPPEQINKVFDPFFSTKVNGTGLGLFVSYGIIQNHNGTIEVDSKVNQGTIFTIRLPSDQPAPQ
ncbi:MAG: response regulator [Anaerolineaceae bacterium]|nr:response regulator [Anaerolineaceae bacterium]